MKKSLRYILGVLGVVALAYISSVIVLNVFFRSTKSNGTLLRELIDFHFFEKAASDKIAQFRQSPGANKSSPDEWVRYEQELRECMVKEARAFLASQDTYLLQRSDSGAEIDMTRRFLGRCRVVE